MAVLSGLRIHTPQPNKKKLLVHKKLIDAEGEMGGVTIFFSLPEEHQKRELSSVKKCCLAYLMNECVYFFSRLHLKK